MITTILDKVLGPKGGIASDKIDSLATRDVLSDYLPYLYHHKDENKYLNLDNTIGYMWECSPLVFEGNRQLKQLENLLSTKFPKGTVLQFIFVADEHIKHIVDSYVDNKVRKNPIVQKSINEYAKFLMEGTKGIKNLNGIPTRNMRMFFTIKSVEDLNEDTVSGIEETLKGADFHPSRLGPKALKHFLCNFFNSTHNQDILVASDGHTPLRKQIINADTEIDFNDKEKYVKIGNRYARCITPKNVRSNIDPLMANKLAGGINGVSDDQNQICTPWMWTVNIVIDDAKFELHNKASMTMSQRGTGSFAREIMKRVEEYTWALDKAENETFLKVMPIIWVFADNIKDLRESTSRVKKIWEGAEFQMQEETILQKTLLIAALPFGLYNVKSNIKIIDRHFLWPVSTTARFLPVQGDFAGGSKPVMTLIGRKGQLVTLDVFDERATAHNFVVSAATGAGKSFKLNRFLQDYYASGALVRCVDLGYSYQKTCNSFNGRFIDVGEDNVVMNPFLSHATSEDDINKDLIAAANLIAEMAYSASGSSLHETEWTLIKAACFWAYRNGETVNGIDSVQRYLAHFPEYDEDKDIPNLDFAKKRAQELAFNLRDFTTKGPFGRFFNGKATFDISNDEFVVLEMEKLKGQRELFSVIVMQVMNAVTQDLYLSDRGTQRFILFEEAASMLKKQGHSDLSRLGNMIEEGYRRARKYYGAFGVVLQDMLDLKAFGPVGDVINTNAPFKFFLEGKTYEKASDEKIISHKGLALDLLVSVRNNKPKYSEMYVQSDLYSGVARLCVDNWNYWMSTSTGNEVKMYNNLVSQGLTPLQAISRLSGIPV